jgi:adenylate cyclase
MFMEFLLKAPPTPRWSFPACVAFLPPPFACDFLRLTDGAGFNKDVHGVPFFDRAGLGERGESIGLRRFDIGALVNEKTHDVSMAIFCRNDERCGVIAILVVIDGGAVFDKCRGRIDMSTVGGGMEGCQSAVVSRLDRRVPVTDLSQVSGLFVIARNSTFSYKGKTIDPRQVARELGVRYVLEGSIQRAGDAVRINAQLIDATTDGHAWADRYDGSMADVFALQDKVTHSIAGALAVSLSGLEEQLLTQQETKVPAAYDAFLRGWGHYRRTTPEDFAKSIPYFEEAIRLDPEYGRAYAALAMVYILANDWNWLGNLGISSLDAWSRAQHYLAEAEKRPTSTSFQARANYVLKTAAEPNLLLHNYKEAIALDPSDSWSFAYLAWAQVGMGRQSEAMSNIKVAMRLDPHYPPVFLHILGVVQLSSGNYEQAAKSLNQATKLNPDNEFTLIALAAAYGYLDRKQDAERVVARYNELRAKRGDVPLTIETMPQIFFGRYVTDTVLMKGLRLASVPESLKESELAVKNRLRADDMRNLLFGHQLHGRTVSNGNEHAAEITTEGVAKITGDWGTMTAATTSFKNGEVCFTEAAGGSFCAAILSNPAGTRPAENEYIWLDATGAFPFSQIEQP